jgi:hypothetical protein
MSFFATIVRAEPGWKVILCRRDGSASVINVKYWGLGLSREHHPLDNTELDLSSLPNFVHLLNPSFPMTGTKIAAAAWRKARELSWV